MFESVVVHVEQERFPPRWRCLSIWELLRVAAGICKWRIHIPLSFWLVLRSEGSGPTEYYDWSSKLRSCPNGTGNQLRGRARDGDVRKHLPWHPYVILLVQVFSFRRR